MKYVINISIIFYLSLLIFSSCNIIPSVKLKISNNGDCIIIDSDTSYYFETVAVHKNNNTYIYEIYDMQKNRIYLKDFIRKTDMDYEYLSIRVMPYNAVPKNRIYDFIINKSDVVNQKQDTIYIKGDFH